MIAAMPAPPRTAAMAATTKDGDAGLPRGFHRLIATQFVSALADNALLIVSIALLQRQGWPGWWAPLLKVSSTLSYVLLAPWVGALADAGPKARLMARTNALKAVAVMALLAGLNPLACFALVGIGAAAYAPAKYGLVTELVGPQRLVQANSWIEVSVVCAVLLGTLLGGLLVGPTTAQALAAVLALYGLSALLNIGLPDSGARYPQPHDAGRAALGQFVGANRRLWRDRLGGLSLAVTTLFWGVGATLQFLVLRWAVDVLGLPLSHAAVLQATVALGVVAGAWAAGRWFSLARAGKALPLGIVLGALVAGAAHATQVATALPLLVLVGAVGGLLLVPMNALLQHRGHQLLSAGRSIAVQNFNENLSILLMLGAYAALLALGLDIVSLMVALGTLVALLMGALLWRHRRRPPAVAATIGSLPRP
jgi:MFS family permease